MTEDLLHPFDRAIYLSPLDAVRFEGELSPDWCIHSTPHGGYLMALIANAMQRVSRKTSTPIITATGFRGAITFHVQAYESLDPEGLQAFADEFRRGLLGE